jgi:hypothetical protein
MLAVWQFWLRIALISVFCIEYIEKKKKGEREKERKEKRVEAEREERERKHIIDYISSILIAY